MFIPIKEETISVEKNSFTDLYRIDKPRTVKIAKVMKESNTPIPGKYRNILENMDAVETGKIAYTFEVKPSKYFPFPPKHVNTIWVKTPEKRVATRPKKNIPTATLILLIRISTERPTKNHSKSRIAKVVFKSLSFFPLLIASSGLVKSSFTLFKHIKEY